MPEFHVKIKRMRKVSNYPVRWELMWNDEDKCYKVVSIDEASPFKHIKIKEGYLIRMAIVAWDSSSPKKIIPTCDGINGFNETLTREEFIELHIQKLNTPKHKSIIKNALHAIRKKQNEPNHSDGDKIKHETFSNNDQKMLYPSLVDYRIQPSAPSLLGESNISNWFGALSLSNEYSSPSTVQGNIQHNVPNPNFNGTISNVTSPDTISWGGKQFFPHAHVGESIFMETSNKKLDDYNNPFEMSNHEPVCAPPMDPAKRRKVTTTTEEASSSAFPTGLQGESGERESGDDQDKLRHKKTPTDAKSDSPAQIDVTCCVEYCNRQGDKKLPFRFLKGSWPLKAECLNKPQADILSCRSCYQEQNVTTGHHKKCGVGAQNIMEKKVHIGLVAGQTYMEEAICSCSDCPRKKKPVLVSRFSMEETCPFHTMTVRTKHGNVDFFAPCSSYKAVPKQYNTVIPGSKNPKLFVCHDCGPKFAYYAAQLDTDVSNLINITEHETTDGTVTVTAPTTVMSPGLAASVKRHLNNLLVGPKGLRCSGIKNEYALQYCMNQLLRSMAQGDHTVAPKALIIRAPDGNSIILSENCSGRRTARSDLCSSCQSLWNDDLRFKAARTQKNLGMTVVHPKTKLSVLTTDQLRAAIEQRTNLLQQSKFDEKKLKAKIKQLQEKFVEAPSSLKLTAARLEMVIDQAVENNVINPDSPVFMLLLQTCKNMRNNESGKSKGNRYSLEVLTLASWLAARCRESGYKAATELIPGLPSWNTLAYFRSRFASYDESAGINQEMIKRMFTFVKEKKGRMVAGLHFDEMSCMQGLVICQRTGKTVGFEEPIDMEQLNKDYEAMCAPAEQIELSTQEMQQLPPLVFEEIKVIEQTEETTDEIEETEAMEEAAVTEELEAMDIQTEPQDNAARGDDNIDEYNLASRDLLVKQFVVYFLSSIEGDLSFPVASFAVKSMNSAKVGQHIETVTKTLDILAAEVDLHLDIQYLVCDGATYSDAYFRSVSANGHEMPYPGREGIKVLSILSDPPHLMKKLRNPTVDDNVKRNLTLLVQVNHIKTKALWTGSVDQNLSSVFATPEEEEKFQAENLAHQRQTGFPMEDPMSTYNPEFHVTSEELDDEKKRYDINVFQKGLVKTTMVEMPFHSLFYLSTISSMESTVLRPKHINLTPKTKMNVKKAVQVLSTEVADECARIFVKAVWTDKANNVPGSEHPFPNPFPLIQYIKHAENMFSVMNAMTLDQEVTQLHFRNGKSVNIPKWWHKLLSCYLFFKNWLKSLKENDMDIGKCFIPMPTFRHLEKAIRAMIAMCTRVQREYPDIVICPRSCNQDDVENYFSLVRDRWASRNPTVAQIQQTTPMLSMLYQMRVQFGEEREVGSYSKSVKVFGVAVPTGAIQPLLSQPRGFTVQAEDSESQESELLKKFSISDTRPEITRKEQYHFRRHLITALKHAKNCLPTSSSMSQDDIQFLRVAETPNGFKLLHGQFDIFAKYLRQHFFNTRTYKGINMKRIVDQFLHSPTFQTSFWSNEFFSKLNCTALPLPPFQEKLLQKFVHRIHAHYIWEDGLNPGREANLRARIVGGRAIDSRTPRLGTAEDECYRCNRIGHWARHCNLPPDPNHLQNITCYNCGAVGHTKDHCTHDLRSNKPYRTYPPGVTLSQVINKLEIVSTGEFKAYETFSVLPSIGIEQLTTA